MITNRLSVEGTARYLSKLTVREEALKKLASNREADVNNFVSFAMSAPVQKGLGLYLESLSKKG